ncbi:helix-turn-helix domain-containing protein [Cribrihabitans neustonicus]|uniref:helix-turn-helix domain-containing protein n=1 Tax=Cribrihabitans neustonicus TaxID=1429085 RepID=UPI003B5C2FEA
MDLLDQFAAAGGDADRWRIANAAMAGLGASALNVAEVGIGSPELFWWKSSMSEQVVDRYVERRFQEADYFVTQAGQPDYTPAMRTAELLRNDAVNPRLVEMNRTLHDAGFTFGYVQQFSGSAPGRCKLVTFCSGEDPRTFQPVHLHRIRAVAMAVAAFVGAPGGDDPAAVPLGGIGATPQAGEDVRLTGRERQVLALLAEGCLNAGIAHRLDIAEVTVRKTLLSARRKLGAQTREQALARAIRLGLLDAAGG